MVRWLKRDDSGDTPVWGMIQDQRYIEYDEHQDEYTQVATLPEEDVGEGVVNADYGLHLTGESFSVSSFVSGNESDVGIEREGDRLYVLDNDADLIRVLLLDGTPRYC